MRINNKYPGNTEYRKFKITVNGVEKIFLQFGQIVKIRRFPIFWKLKMVSRWYFIPNDEQYLKFYFSNKECPTNINVLKNSSMMYIQGTDVELESFKKTYPNINLYFHTMNMKRALYMDSKEKSQKINL